MGNTFSNINDAKVVAQGLNSLQAGLAPMRVFSLGVSADPVSYTISVPVASAIAPVIDSTDYESGDSTVAGVVVTLSGTLSASWFITETQNAAVASNVFELLAREAGYSVAYAALTTVLSDVTAAHFADVEDTNKVTITAGAFCADTVAKIAGMGTTLNWKPQGRGLMLTPSYMTSLRQDPACHDWSASQLPTLQSGTVNRLQGFDVYECSVIPGNSENLVGFACIPEAMAVGIAPLNPVDDRGYLYSEIVTDPETGISFSYRRWVDTKTGRMWGMMICRIGHDALRGTGVVRIESA